MEHFFHGIQIWHARKNINQISQYISILSGFGLKVAT